MENKICLRDTETGEAKLGGKAFGVESSFSCGLTCVAFSPDGGTIAARNNDKTIRLHNADTGETKPDGRSFVGHDSNILFVTFSPDGKTLASGSNDTTIHLWDAETGDARLVESLWSLLQETLRWNFPLMAKLSLLVH
jgi:WD40 repeat protein